MPQINSHTKYYWTKFNKKVEQFNKPAYLPSYFDDLIGEKTKVRIAEVGCGLVNTIGEMWNTAEVEIVCSDAHADSFNSMWDEKGLQPLHPIHKEDMEALSYEANSFDIVHCRNALDHTEDPLRAIEEMKRVSRQWVYLLHAPDQMSTYGGHHYFDARFKNGKTVFYGKEYSFVVSGAESYLDRDGLIVTKIRV